MRKEPQPKKAIKVFYSYSHRDEKLRDLLETHLALLKRRRVISSWHDRRIGAGNDWAGEIDEHMKSADIILLLVSANFIASKYCYDVELKLAMKRHRDGEALIIPIILRPCDLTGVPFGRLQSLPKDRRPVTKWPNRDDAFTDIANGIRSAAEELKAKRRASTAIPVGQTEKDQPVSAGKSQAAVAEKKQAAGAHAASLIPRPPVVGFIARRDKQGRDIVEHLSKELSPGTNQLVALWGPGGTGKTTLAAEVVRATEDVFKGRVAWASSLRRADFSMATLLDEIATQLGHANLRTLAPEPKAAEVAALVAAHPTLVVLDNFETIDKEEQARCLDFLAQSAACPTLITTRSFVDRDDVTNVELDAMSIDEAREFLRRLIERTPRPQNFAQLDRDDLIQKCESNPLILQWVVRQIILSKSPRTALDYLTQGEGDAAERVFARSFNLPQLGDDGRAA
ncbi:MAG: TIR domain-containing protein, partial [Acidobacteriota bacterium]|nr:TIR domain-containing protein [Acidobacteriota bacterium]